MDDRLNFIFRRRSIRKYLDTPVEPEKIDLLLQAGMAAPSAMNNQPWEFVVVTEAEQLEKLRTTSPYCKFKVPLVISVCASTSVFKNPGGKLFWVQDCSAATENIMLAASALGLGSCWIGVYPIFLIKKRVMQTLAIPEHVTPLNLIYLGYPAVEKEARTQYDADRVHWQSYGNQPHLNKA